jgi:hypothetical protein
MHLDVMLSANARGTVVAGWNTSGKAPAYRVKRAGARRFGPVRRLPVESSDDLDGLAVDRDGDLHVLITHGGGGSSKPGVSYMTNASGRWRSSRIPQSRCRAFVEDGCVRPSLLAYDAVSDRVVVVEQHDEIRIASKDADAREFGRVRRVRAANGRGLVATSVTRHGRRTTLGLARYEAEPDVAGAEISGPFHVLSRGRLVRVRGTGAEDLDLHVAAVGPDRVQVAWRRVGWARGDRGIWTAQLAGSSIRRLRQRTRSAYDLPTSLAPSRGGRALVAYRRA